MSGTVGDTWTRPALDSDGRPVLDPRGRPTRERTDRWGKGQRWRARWRDEQGRAHAQRAETREAAQAILDGIRVTRAAGGSTDPRRGRATVGEYAVRWLDVAAVKQSARSWNEGAVRGHLVPRWGAVPVADVTTAAVREWAAQLARTPNGRGGTLSASRRRGLLLALGAVLDLAVQDRAIVVNPARGVTLPRVVVQRSPRVDPRELHRLLAALSGQYEGAEVAAMLQGYAGLRWSELVALDVPDYLPAPSPRVVVDDAVVEVAGHWCPGPTKTHAVREAPLPRFVADRVEAWIGDRTSGPLVPGPRGGRYRRGTWRRHWTTALATSGLADDAARQLLNPHKLRHAAASQAIGAGADVKVVAAMLGHADATLTLNVYGHLLEDRLADVADRMSAYAPPAPVSTVCPPEAPAGGRGRAHLRRVP